MKSDDPPAVSDSERSPGAKPARLLFLDGLRGLAALYVVAHHAFIQEANASRPSLLGKTAFFFDFGRSAVDIFIVLSGFCMMMPYRRITVDRPMSVLGFYKRRVMRIVPPYYTSLLLGVALAVLVPGLNQRNGTHWDSTLPAFGATNIVAHLLLIQNLNLRWAYKLNHVLWSIATEFQMYLLFPILLLPIQRKAGSGVLCVVAVLAGIILFYAAPSLRAARPWYVALFAFGMACAVLPLPDPARPMNRLRHVWGLLALLLLLAAAGMGFFKSTFAHHVWAADLLVGASTFCLIRYCHLEKFCHRETSRFEKSRPETAWMRNPVLATLESRVAVWLGIISYSLYLVHPPIIAMIDIFMRHELPHRQHIRLCLLVLGPCVSVAGGWLFYEAVERWFLPTSDPRRQKIVRDHQQVPAAS
jgi:peptidoglycan/LPS O-acetylase OafA/YrhL